MSQSPEEFHAEFLRRQAEQRAPDIEKAFQERGHIFYGEYVVLFHDTVYPTSAENDSMYKMLRQGYNRLGYFQKYDGINLSPGSTMNYSEVEDKRVFSDEFVNWITGLARDQGRGQAVCCTILYKESKNR